MDFRWSAFKVSRILGLFPFDDAFQCCKKWLIYCICLQLLSSPIVMEGLYKDTKILQTGHYKATQALVVLNDLINIQYFFSNIFTVFHLMRKRAMVFHLLGSINKEIDQCFDFPKTRFYTIYFNLSLCTLLIILWLFFSVGGFGLKNIKITLTSLIISNSPISFTSQLWDLGRVLSILIRETTKGFDERSISALERMSTYGEAINDIYGPLLFLMVVCPFFEVVCYSYIILLPVFPDLLELNILTLLYIILCVIKLGMIVYSCRRFLVEVSNFISTIYNRLNSFKFNT